MASDHRSVERRIPRDAAVVINVLRSMGVEEWEPRVVNQLMEFVHRYTAEVLEESVTYASHAGREGSAVSLDDVKLAIAAKLETQFIRPTSVEELSGYAKLVNKKPLPQLMNRPGIHVAQTENLLSPNYQFFPRGFQMVEEGQRVAGGEGEDVQMGAGAEPAKEMSPPTAANEPTAMAKGGTVEFALGKRKK